MDRVAPAFFERSADVVARDLLGSFLVIRRTDGRIERLMINETEAYLGEHDLACHASKGRTKRTEVLYHQPGTIYMYLIYGMYWMLNIVTGPEGYPAAVLVRGAGEYHGPGKLTKALGIDGSLNDQELGKGAGLWIERGKSVEDQDVLVTARIGVEYAKEWAEKPLRFVLKDR